MIVAFPVIVSAHWKYGCECKWEQKGESRNSRTQGNGHVKLLWPSQAGKFVDDVRDVGFRAARPTPIKASFTRTAAQMPLFTAGYTARNSGFGHLEIQGALSVMPLDVEGYSEIAETILVFPEVLFLALADDIP